MKGAEQDDDAVGDKAVVEEDVGGKVAGYKAAVEGDIGDKVVVEEDVGSKAAGDKAAIEEDFEEHGDQQDVEEDVEEVGEQQDVASVLKAGEEDDAFVVDVGNQSVIGGEQDSLSKGVKRGKGGEEDEAIVQGVKVVGSIAIEGDGMVNV
ncbi:hypothetical protein LWI29_019969 [Acer saccharum]|uniref:Uncharacterized protein n=1 Tax=Acer saccharum TaxID=4024 RepID=A0AA39TFV0_ACESA|nr:hypothetical protein LWI29_019969 [Acer saccharum]